MRAGTLLRRLENFSIEKTSNAIQIRMNSEFITSDCAHHFLARWWINEKPLAKAARNDEQARKLLEGTTGNSLYLHLNLNLETLGAKPGDKIGVQFLYCPSGIENVDYKMAELQMERAPGETIPMPVVSNKIEFTAEASSQNK